MVLSRGQPRPGWAMAASKRTLRPPLPPVPDTTLVRYLTVRLGEPKRFGVVLAWMCPFADHSKVTGDAETFIVDTRGPDRWLCPLCFVGGDVADAWRMVEGDE